MSSYSLVDPTGASADGSHHIDAVCDELGLRNTRLVADGGSVLGGALDFIRTWELPPRSRIGGLLLPLLQGAARDGVTIMLDGEGGDLLFDAPSELMGEHRLLPQCGDGSRRLPPWIRARDASRIVDSDGSTRWKSYDGPRWWARRAEALFCGQHALGLRDDVRRRGLMAGLSSRSPLLDLDLVDFVLQMPPELAVDPLMGRQILREAMSGLLPGAVRLRRGNSYVSELTRRCLTGYDLALIRGLLGGLRAELRAFLDMTTVRSELVDVSPLEHPRGLGYWIRGAWALVTAECWLRHQAESRADDGWKTYATTSKPPGLTAYSATSESPM